MNREDDRLNCRLALILFTSFLVFASAVVLRVGIGATPYDTTDSAGHPMGFNDPLHAEHYLIMLGNFNPEALLKIGYAYEWGLFAAHVLGVWVLFGAKRIGWRGRRWFFAAQPLLFPFGLLALPILPFLVFDFITRGMDREGFVDIPFVVVVAHPVWILASLWIAFALRGTDLGVARVWRALTVAVREGIGKFSEAMR